MADLQEAAIAAVPCSLTDTPRWNRTHDSVPIHLPDSASLFVLIKLHSQDVKFLAFTVKDLQAC